MDTPKISAYFARIGLPMPDKIVPDAELLRTVVHAHCLSVPFENLDALRRDPTPLDPESMFQRIVVQKRGGLCLDLNGLLAWLLTELGYKVGDYFAEQLQPTDPPFPHRLLVAEDIQGIQWYCDVGSAGKSPSGPVLLREDLEQTVFGERVRLKREGEKWILEKFRKNEWGRIYGFVREPHNPEDFMALKVFCATDRTIKIAHGAHFSLDTPHGRKTLAETLYRESYDGSLFSHECTQEELLWACAQFGLDFAFQDVINS